MHKMTKKKHEIKKDFQTHFAGYLCKIRKNVYLTRTQQ